MEQTLLLNASYEPLKIVHWQKAVTLWCQGKVEVISVYDREIRAVSFSFKLPSVIRLLRYIKIKRRFDYVPFSRANIYARDDHQCQYCGDEFPDERADLRSCGAGRPGRPEGLGEHRQLLRHLQPPEGRPDAGRSRHAPAAGARSGPSRRRPFALPSDCATRRRAGATTSTGTSSWRRYMIVDVNVPLRSDRDSVPSVGDRRRPHHHRRLRISRSTSRNCPRCTSATRARASSTRRRRASPSLVPAGLEGGRRRSASTACAGRRAFVDVAAPFATGLHQVDNPVFDRAGQSVRHLQRHARPAGAGVDLPRAAQRHARDVLLRHRQSDVDGDRAGRRSVRVEPVRGHGLSRRRPTARSSRSPPISASPAGWRSSSDGTLFVGDRSGTIFRVDRDGQATTLRVAAAERRGVPPRARPGRRAVRHRADAVAVRLGLSGSTRTATVDASGTPASAGRRGSHSIRAALCSSSKRSRAPADCTGCRPEASTARAGRSPGPVSSAWRSTPDGGLVVCSNDTAYRLARFERARHARRLQPLTRCTRLRRTQSASLVARTRNRSPGRAAATAPKRIQVIHGRPSIR